MAEAIVERHNAVVKDGDEVYDLGDFAFRCRPEYAAAWLARLNGRRRILWGNHDKPLRQALRQNILRPLIDSGRVAFIGDPDPKMQTAIEIRIDGQKIILAHYAQRTWAGAFRGAWHLHGHSHGNLPSFSRSMDVGVDAHDYAPVRFEQVQERMAAAAEFAERSADGSS